MAYGITLKGIDQAISSLNYRNNNSLKYRLVNTIRQFYENERSVESMHSIDTEELVKVLWNTEDDPEIIKKKRKNLSSVKSSLNANLKQLYKEKKNPEGIIIGPANVFVMSNEAKDDALRVFKLSAKSEETVSLGQIKDILNIVNEILSDPEAIAGKESAEGVKKFDQVKNLIRSLSEKVGLGASETIDPASQSSIALSGQKDTTGDSDLPEVTELIKEPEELEVDDAIEEVEVADDLDETEAKEDLEEIEVADDLEESEVSGASGDKETPGGSYETEAKEGGGGVKEVVGDSAGAVEKAGHIERGGPKEGIGLEETEDAHAQDEQIETEELIEEPEELEVDDAIEEVEVADDLDETEAKEDLEEVNVEEEIEHDEFEEMEDIEELDEEEAIEEIQDAETDEDIEEDKEDVEEVDVEDDFEEVDEVEEAEEADILAGDLGEKYSDGGYEGNDEIRKYRLLAEKFNNLLGAIDRYYNQYILIPEGEYIVGSKRPKKDEKPEQAVHLSPFYIGKFQVTNALFEIFIEKTGYRTTAEQIGYGTVYSGRLQKTVDEKTGLERFIWNAAIMSKTIEGACWYQPLGRGSTIHNKRNHPVVQVSPEDAIAFAAWTGKSIPTEDEWEAASRTAKGYAYPWGNEWNKDSCNIEESYVGDTTPVDKYVEFANDYEIVDVVGNVLEWTLDRSELPSLVNDRSKYFVVKGGSWISGNGIRLFSRFKLEPKSHSNILGFRCVAY